jgi:hypothetical protein
VDSRSAEEITMGTRGFTGVVIKGEAKFAYQQFDSYPSGVGAELLEWLQGLQPREWEKVAQQAVELQMIPENTEPPSEMVLKAREMDIINLGVSTQSETDAYCVARGAQGDLEKILELGYAVGHPMWPADSLFCEWGYLVNFDEMTLEVYEGFQKGEVVGRFASLDPGNDPDYSPVTLRATFPLSDLPTTEVFVKELEGEQ